MITRSEVRRFISSLLDRSAHEARCGWVEHRISGSYLRCLAPHFPRLLGFSKCVDLAGIGFARVIQVRSFENRVSKIVVR